MQTIPNPQELFQAIRKQNPEQVKSLLEKSNPPERNESENSERIEIPEDQYGCSPLYWAVKLGNEDITNALLNFGFSPMDTNRDGQIALSAIFENKNNNILSSCIKYLVDKYPDQSIAFPRNPNGSTLLHTLISSEEVESTISLIPKIHPDSWFILDSQERSPMDWIAILGLVEIADSIPIDIFQKSLNEKFLLHRASEYNQLEFLQFVEKKYPQDFSKSIHIQDKEGNSLLHLAVESDAIEILPYLLDLNIDSRLKNSNGETVYQISVREKYHHCLKILKKHFIAKTREISDKKSSEFLNRLNFIENEKILSDDEMYQLNLPS